MKYSFWKSTCTGTVYAMPADWAPRPEFVGWEEVTYREYIDYRKENGLPY